MMQPQFRIEFPVSNRNGAGILQMAMSAPTLRELKV